MFESIFDAEVTMPISQIKINEVRKNPMPDTIGSKVPSAENVCSSSLCDYNYTMALGAMVTAV